MIHPKHILRHHGIEPKKSLGQNFLIDANALNQIVTAAGVEAVDRVLEIGPGLGALTVHLAQTAHSVIAVELDDRLLTILSNEISIYKNVDIVHGDILDQDPAKWFDGPYKVVANVPYYITGAILRHLLAAAHKPSLMVLTVQKEVAQRIVASPPDMSLLAASVQYYGSPKIVDTIKAGAFWPRPDVDSAVIRIDLDPDREYDPSAEKAFFRVLRAGFSQKRKQLKNNFRSLGYSKGTIERVMQAAGVDSSRRAQTLSLPEWHQLSSRFSQE